MEGGGPIRRGSSSGCTPLPHLSLWLLLRPTPSSHVLTPLHALHAPGHPPHPHTFARPLRPHQVTRRTLNSVLDDVTYYIQGNTDRCVLNEKGSKIYGAGEQGLAVGAGVGAWCLAWRPRRY